MQSYVTIFKKKSFVNISAFFSVAFRKEKDRFSGDKMSVQIRCILV